MTNGSPPRWKKARPSSGWGAALIIVLLTFVAYMPALRGGFVFDDNILITDNPMVKAGDGLHRFWFTTEAADYFPLTESLWWLQWRFWGTSAAGYHVVNVLFHAFNSVLVWLILRRLKIPGAWLAGLVFAVHPVNVATAAWISEQKNTLSMLFGAMAILLYLKFDEEGCWHWYGLSLGAFLLALLSKTAVATLPVVLLGCVWWLRGRVRRRDLICSTPFFALSLVLGLVTIWFQYQRALGGHPIRPAGFLSRLATAGCVPWFYLGKALLPFNLSAIYPQWNFQAALWVSYLPGLALVGCLMLFWWKRKTWGRSLFFAFGYFVVTLFPVLGFFDQSFHQYSMVSDHLQYHAIVGVIALAVGAAVAIGRRAREMGRPVGKVAGIAVLLVLGVATWRRAGVYGSAETLWRDTVAKNPNAWMAHNNLGLVLQNQGKMSEAIAHYERALHIKPDFAEGHNDLGNALVQTGKLEEAITHYQQALRINPYFAEAHNNLGVALEHAGRLAEAIEHYEQALRIEPDSAAAHYTLGLALRQAGQLEAAVAHYERALHFKPDFAEAHYSLGNALLQLGKREAAIQQYDLTLRINPHHAGAHNNLGVMSLQAGRIQEAIGHYEEALRIQPDFPGAQSNLTQARAVQ